MIAILKRNKWLQLLALWFFFFVGGCATIIEGPEQNIKIQCQPNENVSVLVDGQPSTDFEGTVFLSKKRDAHFVTFAKANYTSSTIYFNREINPLWPIADLIWGPAAPLAWIVDWWTGSQYQIVPKDLYVVLRQKEEPE